MTEQPEDFRTRVLDGAVRVLLDGGFGSDRLHSAIAREAGLSRPTVYKYGGTLEEIRAAVIARELAGLLEGVAEALTPTRFDADYLIELLATLVDYAQHMPLLEAALRDIPDQVLSLLTLHADVVMDQVRLVGQPHFDAIVARGELTEEEAELTLDFVARLAISLVLIRTGHPTLGKDQLRAYLEGVFAVVVKAGGRRPRRRTA